MKIFLIVILSILGVIILIDIIIAIYIAKKIKKINRKNNEIYSIMTQQYDLIKLLGKMIIDQGIHLPDDLIINFNMHESEKELSTMERLNIKTSILKMSNGLILVAETTSLKDDEKFISLKTSLESFNRDYRKKLVLINQDISNYNYWINFLFFKLFAKLFHLRKKDYLQ